MYSLTAMCVWKNVCMLGYPALESVLSIIDLVDEAILCVDPNSDPDTLELVKAICNSPKYGLKVRDVWHVWPSTSPDGSAIGEASQFCLSQVQTEFAFNLQADEVISPHLYNWLQYNWQDLAQKGIEAFKFKVLHTEFNAQQYQGGNDTSTYDWQSGAGYNSSFKLIKMRPDTAFEHDAWTFKWYRFKTFDVQPSAPIVHLHDFFRDHYIAMRQNAGTNLWTDPVKYGNYKADADKIEATKDEWWSDQRWTSKTSPFMDLLPECAKRLIGKTHYEVDWSLLT